MWYTLVLSLDACVIKFDFSCLHDLQMNHLPTTLLFRVYLSVISWVEILSSLDSGWYEQDSFDHLVLGYAPVYNKTQWICIGLFCHVLICINIVTSGYDNLLFHYLITIRHLLWVIECYIYQMLLQLHFRFLIFILQVLLL